LVIGLACSISSFFLSFFLSFFCLSPFHPKKVLILHIFALVYSALRYCLSLSLLRFPSFLPFANQSLLSWHYWLDWIKLPCCVDGCQDAGLPPGETRALSHSPGLGHTQLPADRTSRDTAVECHLDLMHAAATSLIVQYSTQVQRYTGLFISKSAVLSNYRKICMCQVHEGGNQGETRDA